MIHTDITTEEWCEIHDIEISSAPCESCGCIQTANIPYEDGRYVGFVAPLHECGKEYQLISLNIKNLTEREVWKKTVHNLIRSDDNESTN